MVNFKGTSDLSEEKAGKESESEQKNVRVERKIYGEKSRDRKKRLKREREKSGKVGR